MKTNTLEFDAQALREKILDLAMRGKLVPQDPNDEPASVLLKKIKAEKEKLIKEKRIKKSKPLAPISDNEKPFDIPDSWEWVRLGDAANFIGTGMVVPSSQQYKDLEDETMIPYFKMNNIGNWNGEFDLTNIVYIKKNEKVDKYLISSDELLFNTRNSRELVGKTTVVPTINKRIVANNNILRITTFGNIQTKFLNYILISPYGKNLFFNLTTATTNVAAIYQKQLREIMIPLPPLEEQSRIAAKIAQLFALLRKVESSTQQYAKLQTLLKSKVLDLAMRGKLVEQDPNDEPASVLLEKIKAEKQRLIKEKKIKKSKPLPLITDDEKPFDIPDSWEWVRCKTVTTIGNFKNVVPHNIKVGENLIELADIESYSGKLIISEKVMNTVGSNKYVYLKGDILFAKLRPYLKKILIAPNDGVCTTELLPISGIIINNKFLYYVFISDLFFNQIQKEMHGVNLPRVSPKKISELIIPLPPLTEQRRIVVCLDNIYSKIDRDI